MQSIGLLLNLFFLSFYIPHNVYKLMLDFDMYYIDDGTCLYWLLIAHKATYPKQSFSQSLPFLPPPTCATAHHAASGQTGGGAQRCTQGD